ncbi:MAG: tRNA pseudouridine(38-40) synthase TruA [Solobacterium sp.]|nr:tRNA pseudouridine(38-40) synthase TruA [Solobacterium sp.]
MRYKCTVAYNGAPYEGWQTQKKGNSVQEEIENALFSLTHEEIHIVASGRTDTKVNAYGQVFHFDSDMDMPERKWQGGINTYLSDNIYIRKVEKVDSRFHARFCVRQKRYDYRINLGEKSVFNKDNTYQCPYHVNIQKMKQAAKYLVGTHDFSAFCSNSYKEIPNQVRTVSKIQFQKEGDILTISFYGKGFLRYMVRMMSAQLLEVGRGKIEPIQVKAILEAKSKTRNRKNAHPEGLTLMEVDYFKILALNEEGMLREYLEGDTLPKGWSLKRLEEAVKENRLPRIYNFVTRKTQTPLGSLRITKKGAILEVLNAKAEKIAKAIQAQCEITYTIKQIKERL